MVVTGGFPGRTNVQVYDLSGPVERLPDMTTPRYSHACGYMVNSDDQLVSIFLIIIFRILMQLILTLDKFSNVVLIHNHIQIHNGCK